MKLVYLVTDDTFFWSHRRDLARAARDEGFDVVVATPPGPLRERIEREGFRFAPVRLARSLRPPDLARALADVRRLYRRERPDLVHHVAMRAVLVGGLAARAAGVPAVVSHVTGLGYVFASAPTPVRRAVEAAYAVALSRARGWTIFQNPDDRAHFVARGLVAAERSSVVLGSGVDVRRHPRSPQPPGTPRVLLAARMLRSKGVLELVEAGHLLRARGVRHRLVLAGRPDPRNPHAIPERRLEAWTRAGEAEWLGHVDDVPALLAGVHVACLPSWYREGVPRFLIEALAAALPVVTTDSPGCREVVRPRATGLLVPPLDPRALADALEELLGDRRLRLAMGAAGRELALERFDLGIVVERTLAVYRELLGAHPAGAAA